MCALRFHKGRKGAARSGIALSQGPQFDMALHPNNNGHPARLTSSALLRNGSAPAVTIVFSALYGVMDSVCYRSRLEVLGVTAD